MKRILVLFFLSITLAFGGEAPKAAIQSAEKAVARFREARESATELQSLSEKHRKQVAALSGADSLAARRMRPRDYQPPYRDHIVQDEPARRFFGTLAAAADCKNDTWRLFYDTGLGGGMIGYLDAITGKVLYLHFVPEG